MGGKGGEASTTMEIPDWLNEALQSAVGGGLNDFNRFRTQGMGMIMPRPGETNVNVQNPWDLIGMDRPDGDGPPSTDGPPTDGPPPPPPDGSGGAGGVRGGGTGGGARGGGGRNPATRINQY